MIVVPDIDTTIPYADYPPTFESLQERVGAALRSLSDVIDEGGGEGVLVTDEDTQLARSLFTGSATASDTALSQPGVVIHLQALLSEYDRQVVQSAAQLRTYVTNRLVEDSANPDPRIRLRCYELLGKISDVGLFTEKTEVTLRHRPTEELEQLLRERLEKTLTAEGLIEEKEAAPLAGVPE